MAIIEYDHSPNISPEQRLRSLADSVRRAFEELENKGGSKGNDVLKLGAVASENIVPMKKGGTEASTAAGARQNINFIGYNPITSISEDTPAKWKACGTGFAYIGGAGVLTDSPGNYGVVLNMVYSNEVRQIWFGMYNGDIYHRGGHTTSGWSGTWKKMLDENTMLDMVYPVGAVYISYKSTSPAELFGGTWIAITGRFPYFNAGTATGGSNTTTQTVAQMAKHSHQIGYRSIYAGTGNYLALTSIANETATADSHDTGGSEPQNNMPAYQTLYAWRRTA